MPFEAARRRCAAYAPALVLLVTILLLTRPYVGIAHDARLYMVQALRGLVGEVAGGDDLGADLFFAFGSQDSFTLFSSLYRPLLSALGAGPGHAAAFAIGQGVWFLALIWLARRLFSRREAYAAAAAAILLNPGYGGLGVFGYGENFVTPRLFSEACVMFALGLALQRKRLLAGLAAGLAAALHPLMALPAFGVFFVWAARRRPFLSALALVGGGGAALALAAAGVEPFGRAFMRIDGVWLEVTRERAAFAFLAGWGFHAWFTLLGKAVLTALAWTVARPDERRVIVAVATTAAVGVALTAVGADGAQNALIVNLQPWRALWLFSLLANAAAGILLLRLPPTPPRAFLAIGLGFSAMAHVLGVLDVAAAPFALLAAAALAWERRCGPQTGAGFGLVCAALGLAGLFLAWTYFGLLALAERPAFGQAVAGAIIGAIAVGLAPRLVRREAPLALLVSLALALCAAAVIDRRSAWGRFVESAAPAPELAAFVGEAGATYWEFGAELSWIKLRRASFFSCLQGAGAMFYAGTAHEYARRREGLGILATAGDCGGEPAAAGGARRDVAQLRAACRALPELDTIMLTAAIPDAPARIWRPPLAQSPTSAASSAAHHRYNCADFR